MADATSSQVRTQVEHWIGELETALRAGSVTRLQEIFLTESYWRDMAAITWDVRQYWGQEEVVANLISAAKRAQPQCFEVQPDRTPPRLLPDGQTVDFFFRFRTRWGTGSALVVAVVDETAPEGLRARLIGTTLTGLDAHPVPEKVRRGYVPGRSGETWAQYRRRFKGRCDHNPDVLVLGGGQSGLIMGARLDRLGVPYVIVDRTERAGDGWRSRYDSLALHTPTCVNHLPYVRQPETFPTFVSKDEWGNYLDSYCTFMDLNRWGQTEFLSAEFDLEERRWNVELRVSDGSNRTLHPRHIVTALGYTGTEPYVPDLEGLTDFRGEVLHSSEFVTGEDFKNKCVLVVGTGTSGHDIALDLADNGAIAYMAQRGAACLVPVAEAENFNVDYADPSLTVEELDQRRNTNFVYPLWLKKAIAETERTEREYAEMYDGLRKAGMRLTIGEEKAGWIWRLHRQFSGYYLDVGASQAVIDGRIRIVQWADVERFVSEGLLMADGSVLEFDAVILATGFRNVRTTIERLFGREVADRIGDIGGVADDGEHRNMARPTRQPHLWMLFGGIMDARKMSEVLAWQIVAQLEGVVPSLVRNEDGEVEVLPSGEEVLSTILDETAV